AALVPQGPCDRPSEPSDGSTGDLFVFSVSQVHLLLPRPSVGFGFPVLWCPLVRTSRCARTARGSNSRFRSCGVSAGWRSRWFGPACRADPVGAIAEPPDGLAVLPVVLEQRLSVLPAPGGPPAVPPGQAQEARRLRVGPDRPKEPPQRLQPVRPDGEVDLAVQGTRHVDQAVRAPAPFASSVTPRGS